MLTVLSIDGALALGIAIALIGADFCFVGKHYPLVLVLGQMQEQPARR